MAGKKGRSGRRGYIEEKTMKELLRLSASTIFKALRSSELTLKDKANLASEYIKRQVPLKTEEIGNIAPQTFINVIKNYDPSGRKENTRPILHTETDGSPERS